MEDDPSSEVNLPHGINCGPLRSAILATLKNPNERNPRTPPFGSRGTPGRFSHAPRRDRGSHADSHAVAGTTVTRRETSASVRRVICHEEPRRVITWNLPKSDSERLGASLGQPYIEHKRFSLYQEQKSKYQRKRVNELFRIIYKLAAKVTKAESCER